jgi:uncharacterized protein (DUF1778 family)
MSSSLRRVKIRASRVTIDRMKNPTPRHTLNLRIKPEERDLMDMAAKIRGKNRTDFMLEAARNAAEETLLYSARA